MSERIKVLAKVKCNLLKGFDYAEEMGKDQIIIRAYRNVVVGID